jgi:hypothetical protein
MALFIWLIICLIQLVFSAGTVFFSHKKSTNNAFQLAYNSSRTRPIAKIMTCQILDIANFGKKTNQALILPVGLRCDLASSFTEAENDPRKLFISRKFVSRRLEFVCNFD